MGMAAIDLSCHGFAAILVVMAVPQGYGQCRYELTTIPGPYCAPFGPSLTRASAINEVGEIVGNTRLCDVGPSQAFFWSAEAGYVVLFPGVTESAANDLTNAGQIVGYFSPWSDGLVSVAYLYDGQQAETLGTLPGGNWSKAIAVNEMNCVVGAWGNTSGQPTPYGAFVWQDGTMVDLGSDLGTPRSLARDINDSGQVTGWMGTTLASTGTGFIWQDGVVTELPPLPGGIQSIGDAINSCGHVAGTSRRVTETGESEVCPVLWRDGETIALGLLPGFTHCAATSINDDDQVIGSCWALGSLQRQFIWQAGVMTQLNDLLPSEANAITRTASDINNAGQIAGSVLDATLGVFVGAMLTPEVGPLGDLDRDCAVGIRDFLALLAGWGLCPAAQECHADFNGDGVVNGLDLTIMLGNWGSAG